MSYAVKFGAEIVETAREEYGIKARMVELRSHCEARDAPTPFSVFALYDGRVGS